MFANFNDYQYFNSVEFDSPDIQHSGKMMNKHFIDMLHSARCDARTPFIITSGFRSKFHNKDIGGLIDSSHLKGLASDIYYSNSTQLFLILTSLIKAGFTRIGIGDDFIHVDSDPTKPQNVIWNYY